MRELDDFLPLIRQHAGNVPDPVAFRTLVHAAREFAEVSRLWRKTETMEIIDAFGEVVPDSNDCEIIDIEWAALNDCTLTPTTVEHLDRRYPLWMSETKVGTAMYIVQTAPRTVRMYPAQTGQIDMRVILKPSLDAYNLPDFFLTEHGEHLAMGAAAKALIMPNRAFTNVEYGMALFGAFTQRNSTLRTRRSRTLARSRPQSAGSYF